MIMGTGVGVRWKEGSQHLGSSLPDPAVRIQWVHREAMRGTLNWVGLHRH